MQFKRLKITNFGPIRDLELHFEPNKVYHFVADNDNGKSMIVDAAEALCCNMPHTQIKKYVSDYADFFTVEGEDFEGNVIELTRGSGLSEYKLKREDGSRYMYDKAGQYVPEEIQKIVNVYIDSERGENFNIRKADNKTLFTNTTPTENYSYFQKALGTDRLRESLKIGKKLVNTLKAENEITQGKIELEKSKLDDYVDLTVDKEKMDVYVTEVKKSYETLSQLRRLEDLNEVIGRETATLPDEILNLDKNKLYEEVKDVDRITELIGASSAYALLRTETAKCDEVIQANNEIKSTIEDLRLLDNYSKLESGCSKSDGVIKATEEISELSKSHSGIIEDIKLLNRLVELNRVDEERASVLENNKGLTSELEELKRTKEDLQKVIDLTVALGNTRDKSNKLKDVVEEVQTKRVELDTFMKKNKFCPVVAQREDLRCPFSNRKLEELAQ